MEYFSHNNIILKRGKMQSKNILLFYPHFLPLRRTFWLIFLTLSNFHHQTIEGSICETPTVCAMVWCWNAVCIDRDSVANISPNKIFRSKIYWLFHQNVINCNLHFFSIFYSSILKESLTLKTDLQVPEAENWLYAARNIFTSGQKWECIS